MNTTACSTVAAKKHHEPRQRLRHDELGADDAGQKPDDRLRQPADPDDAARQRVLHQAGRRSRSAGRSTGPDVSATYTTTTSTRSTATVPRTTNRASVV